MKFKTTAILSVVLIGLLGWILWEKPQLAEPEATPEPSDMSSVAQRGLFDPAPESESIVEVTVARRGVDPWRFEKATEEGDKGKWRLVEPFGSVVPSYEVDNIVRTVKDLTYEIKHTPGEPGAVSPEKAGLESPRIEITLEDGEGTTYAVQVGRQAGNNSTYVRRGGEADIYVVKRSLENVAKKNVNDYRDRALVQFAAADATSIEILQRPEQGEPVQYRLVKHDGGDWVFEEPFNADAADQTLNGAISAVSRLRATEWVEYRRADGLGRFGLQFPALEIEVTTEKVVLAEPATGDDSEEPKPEAAEQTEIERFKFAVSDRGPLSNDSSVYFMLDGGDGVALISKATVAKLTPELEKWRTMDIFTMPIAGATQIRLRTAGGMSAELVKDARGQWIFEETGARAGLSAVKELLDTIAGLKALGFVDAADPGDAKFGLQSPRTEVVLTLPGRDQPERIVVGNPTDEVSKRVYYLRRGESVSIAKIRAADAALLDRPPTEYLDKQIINVASGAMQRIKVTRPNTLLGGTEVFSLINTGGTWSLTPEGSSGADASFSTDSAATAKLATTLSSLIAQRVVSSAGGDVTEYGLGAPSVRVAITHDGPRIIKPQGGGADEDTPAVTIELHVASAAGGYYAKLQGGSSIYQLRKSDYEALVADCHKKTVMGFQQSQATSVAVEDLEGTIRFDQKGDGWVFAAEPDLPIDSKKVTNLLIQLQDLRLKRYIGYGVDSLAEFGLDAPAKSVTVAADGETIKLLVSAKACPQDADGSVYAVIAGTSDVFIMTPDSVSRFDISLDDFEKADDS